MPADTPPAAWCEPNERREDIRMAAETPAVLLSTALGRVGATLVDVSRTGCRVRTRAKCHPGDRLVLTIGSLGPRAVSTAWRGDGELGLAFAQPLGWAVVAEMAVALRGAAG